MQNETQVPPTEVAKQDEPVTGVRRVLGRLGLGGWLKRDLEKPDEPSEVPHDRLGEPGHNPEPVLVAGEQGVTKAESDSLIGPAPHVGGTEPGLEPIEPAGTESEPEGAQAGVPAASVPLDAEASSGETTAVEANPTEIAATGEETPESSAGEVEVAQDEAPAGPVQTPRTMYRTKVELPAALDVAGREQVPVEVQNLSGTGAAILYKSDDAVPPEGLWLDLSLPNRPKPLELELRLVNTRKFADTNGEQQQILHVTFPSIRLGEQDAIIAYINNLKLYEGKQFAVAAMVKMEVVTGRRRFAKFTGQTMEIRPDKMKLLMDDFDAIVGADVLLTIMAPHFVDHIDVDEVKVEKVEIVGPRKAEVEVSLAKPDERVVVFIRKHYPGSVKKR